MIPTSSPLKKGALILAPTSGCGLAEAAGGAAVPMALAGTCPEASPGDPGCLKSESPVSQAAC